MCGIDQAIQSEFEFHLEARENDNLGRTPFLPRTSFCSSISFCRCSLSNFWRSSRSFRCSSTNFDCSSASKKNTGNELIDSTTRVTRSFISSTENLRNRINILIQYLSVALKKLKSITSCSLFFGWY